MNGTALGFLALWTIGQASVALGQPPACGQPSKLALRFATTAPDSARFRLLDAAGRPLDFEKSFDAAFRQPTWIHDLGGPTIIEELAGLRLEHACSAAQLTGPKLARLEDGVCYGVIEARLAPTCWSLQMDIDPYDPFESFIDPTTLSIPRSDGTSEKRTLFAAYWRMGATQRFTGPDVTFSDLTATWLRDRYQATVRVTGLRTDAFSQGRRVEARWAAYQTGRVDPGRPVRSIARLEGFALRQDGTGVADGTTLGGRFDVSATRSTYVIGGVSYALYRPDPHPARHVDADFHIFSADFRANVYRWGESLAVDLGAGLGATRQEGGTERGALRGELRAQWRPRNDRWRVYAVYAPAVQILEAPGASRRVNHEVMVFAHVRVLRMLLPYGGRARVIEREAEAPAPGR